MPQRTSRKRDAILHLIQSTTTHPTALWVYEQLKPSIPDLSLGTVYRNIKMFCEEGTLVSVGVHGGEERFDGSVLSHPHLICDSCGKVMDLPVKPIHYHGDDHLAHSIKIDYARTIFHGLCGECAAINSSMIRQKEETCCS